MFGPGVDDCFMKIGRKGFGGENVSLEASSEVSKFIYFSQFALSDSCLCFKLYAHSVQLWPTILYNDIMVSSRLKQEA